ncbi:unnamed protein product [Choristocarpus tenellus]
MGVLAANRLSPWFQKSTNVSAKVALSISPFLFFYMLKTEQTMHRANLNPGAYGLLSHEDMGGREELVSGLGKLKWYHKTANRFYDHPFQMLGLMGVPAVGYIAWSLRNEGHLKFSQKVMVTRVYGQMTVLSMLLATMMFRETMRRRGGVFVEEGGNTERGGDGEDQEESVQSH